jgi:VanZ family protein
VVWATLIYVVSDQPQLPRAPAPLLDLILKKCGHLAEYAVLAALLHRALGAGLETRWRLGLAWVLTVLYAVSDELHQAGVPGRTAAALDVVVDGVGALLGLVACEAVGRWRQGMPLPRAPGALAGDRRGADRGVSIRSARTRPGPR